MFNSLTCLIRDTIIPKLFNACLEADVWLFDARPSVTEAGIDIEGERLMHLSFRDYIALLVKSASEERGATRNEYWKQNGRSSNQRFKNEVIAIRERSAAAHISISSSRIRNRNLLILRPNGQHTAEISTELEQKKLHCSCKSELAAYNSVQDLLRSAKPTDRVHFFNTVVFSSVPCKCETWAWTKKGEKILVIIQWPLERRALGLSHSIILATKNSDD